jgi:tetratricopeptide (TPR) repeat protein
MPERSPARDVERLRSLATNGPPSREVGEALAEALFRSALSLRNDPATALTQLNEAISLDPFRPAFRYHRGLVRHRLAQFGAALSDYEEVLKYDPNNVRVLHQSALALLDSGRTPDAHKRWTAAEAAVRGNGHTPEYQELALFKIQCGRAAAAIREKKFDEARAELAKVKPPTGSEALAGQMALQWLLASGDAASVKPWLDSALEGESGSAVRQMIEPYLAVFEVAAGERAPQIRALPTSTAATKVVRALIAFDATKSTGEAEVLSELCRSDRKDEWLQMAHMASIHHTAAAAYKEEKWELAAETWKKALVFDQHNPVVIQNIALAVTRAGDLNQHVHFWGQLQRLWYTNTWLVPEIGWWSRSAGEKHLAFAAKALEKVRQSKPETPPPDALWLWIEEMECYFLAEQYSFKSALHLLGVPQNCTQKALCEACRALREKTKEYSNLTLPALGGALRKARLKQLRAAVAAVRTAKIRRAYRCPQENKETARVRVLRDRRVAYLLALTEFLERRWKDFSWEEPAAYDALVRHVLAHPLEALQRSFQDAGKVDARTPATAWIRDLLCEFYYSGVPELVEKASQNCENPIFAKAEHLLAMLRRLKPQSWLKLYHCALAERAMGNVDEALQLLRASREACDQPHQWPSLDRAIRDTDKNRDQLAVRNLLNPAVDHINQGRWKQALVRLDESIKRAPKLPVARLYAARCELEMKRLVAEPPVPAGEPGADSKRRALEKKHLDMADQHLSAGSRSADSEQLRDQFAQMRQALATEHMNAKEWAPALHQIDAGLALDTDQAALHALRANCLLAQAIDDRSRSKLSECQEEVEKARRCSNAKKYKKLIKSVAKQVRRIAKKL